MITQPGRSIRVMLVDDHRSVLWGLEKLIDGEMPKMQVVGKATSCSAAIELAGETTPDVVVLDLDLAGESGAENRHGLTAARLTAVGSSSSARSNAPVSPSPGRAASKPEATGFSARTRLPAALSSAIRRSVTYVLPMPVPDDVTKIVAI